jgi:nucleotidyltransferase substrate binding protein (TIGR01987 family)
MTYSVINTEIRWKQRFENFQRAFILLRDGLDSEKELNQLEQEGIIQRFEYTFELAWKLLKDIMENDGIVIERISPNYVIKQAFHSKYITDINTWLKMAGDRNLMSHTYNFTTFEVVIASIRQDYLPMLEEWYMSILMKIAHD